MHLRSAGKASKTKAASFVMPDTACCLVMMFALVLLSVHGSLVEGAVRGVAGIVPSLSRLGYQVDGLEICQPAPLNTCQDKSAGGHPGTIFTTTDGHCAKKIRTLANVKEVAFYTKMAALCADAQFEPLCPFLPRLGGLCQEGGDIYVKMQNLKQSFIAAASGEFAARALDLKIGRYTYSAPAMRRSHVSEAKIGSSLLFRSVQDSMLTSSRREGLRFAGVSGQLEDGMAPTNIFEKTAFYLAPRKVLRRFLEHTRHPQVQACFFEKMRDLQSAVEDASFQKFHLIGASVFMLYDPNPTNRPPDCELYLIDFANSMIVNPSESLFYSNAKHGKFIDSFRQGIARLVRLLAPRG